MPIIEVRIFDQEGAELDRVRTPVNAIPAGLGSENSALIALLDAARKYHASHPTLASIEIEVMVPLA